MSKHLSLFILLIFICGLNSYAEKKELDSVQVRYKGRILTLQRQFEAKLAQIRKSMHKDYVAQIKKEVTRGNSSEITQMQQKVSEMQAEEMLVKKGNKNQFNINILLNKNVLRPNDATLFAGHAYKLFTEKLTWLEAKKRCEDMGGHLVCITSKEEDEFVRRLLGNERRIFIGLQRIGRSWKWVSGEPLKYKNWRAGQGSRDTRETASVLWDNIEVWDDHYIEDIENGFVCEWNF